MLDNQFPSVYQRVQIQLTRGGQKERYYTRIEDFDDQTLTIGMPEDKGVWSLFQPGVILDAIAIAENCLYLFSSAVRSVVQMGHFPVLIVDRPDAPKRLQRRNFFRISASLSVRFRMLDGINERSDEPFRDAVTRDISGGGLLLVMDGAVTVKEYVEMEISLPAATVHAIGRVARVCPRKGATNQLEVGTEFMRIDRGDQESIIRFVFARQRAERTGDPGGDRDGTERRD